jgi:hypothetical protein
MLLDTHFHSHKHHEYRAPTDKSVELLREMENKAREQIEDLIRLPDCDIGVSIYHQYAIGVDQHNFKIIYKMNGKRYDVSYDFDAWKSPQNDKLRDLIIGLRDALAHDIANRILEPAFGQALKQGIFRGL